MAELKTKKTELSVQSFMKKIPEEWKRKDAQVILDLTAIVGFGDRRLKYESGRELDWFIMGFSPRKQNFALYIHGAVDKHQTLLKKLGKYKTGKGCLYVNKLEEVNLPVLNEIILNGLAAPGY